jgi:hypothetical protein
MVFDVPSGNEAVSVAYCWGELIAPVEFTWQTTCTFTAYVLTPQFQEFSIQSLAVPFGGALGSDGQMKDRTG